MKKLLITPIALLALAAPAIAAGIDSRVYACGELESLIVANGFVFIGNPNFQGFAVANHSFCAGGDMTQWRSVATRDTPQCPVVYCIPALGRH